MTVDGIAIDTDDIRHYSPVRVWFWRAAHHEPTLWFVLALMLVVGLVITALELRTLGAITVVVQWALYFTVLALAICHGGSRCGVCVAQRNAADAADAMSRRASLLRYHSPLSTRLLIAGLVLLAVCFIFDWKAGRNGALLAVCVSMGMLTQDRLHHTPLQRWCAVCGHRSNPFGKVELVSMAGDRVPMRMRLDRIEGGMEVWQACRPEGAGAPMLIDDSVRLEPELPFDGARLEVRSREFLPGLRLVLAEDEPLVREEDSPGL